MNVTQSVIASSIRSPCAESFRDLMIERQRNRVRRAWGKHRRLSPVFPRSHTSGCRPPGQTRTHRDAKSRRPITAPLSRRRTATAQLRRKPLRSEARRRTSS